jgi:hypothetical protein
MLQYKANLVLLNSRYGDMERRVLDYFAKYPDESVQWLPKHMDILLMYLLEDGLLKESDEISDYMLEPLAIKPYTLTPAGRDFIGRWLAAKELQ